MTRPELDWASAAVGAVAKAFERCCSRRVDWVDWATNMAHCSD